MDREEIIEKLKAFKANVAHRYPIASMALFGSLARGEGTDASDIDILVEFNGRIGSDFISLANELEQELGSKVDLVSKNGIRSKYFTAIRSDLIYV